MQTDFHKHPDHQVIQQSPKGMGTRQVSQFNYMLHNNHHMKNITQKQYKLDRLMKQDQGRPRLKIDRILSHGDLMKKLQI